MRNTTRQTRENRTITVDFQNEATYYQLLGDGKAFVECVLAFLLALGFQQSRELRSPVRGARHRGAHHRNAPQGVAERVLVVVPSRQIMVPGPLWFRRSDHDNRCPSSGGSHS